ncbi:MAG TPA: nucleoside recognition domain-containing protein, partial [Myxococcota bacterium]|nr:nucleoside recognition domain-containing protein [Myxococcota bacterium]
EVSHFVMELPPYHAPRLRFVFGQAWHRLWAFVKRAGITITIIVTVLAFLNSIGTDGSFGNEDQSDSVLSGIGRAITPVFAPMGIEQDNWPATVGLFTGIFAKEVVVGTLSSLYAQEAAPSGSPAATPDALPDASPGPASAASPEDDAFSLLDGVVEAFATIPEAFGGAFEGLADPLGTGLVGEDEEAIGEEVGAGPVVFQRMRSQFTPQAAYAYLLFVLLYIPCVAAMAAAIREMGAGLGWLLAAYTGVVAWSTATLFYQLSTGPALFPVALALALLGILAALLWVLGRTVYRPAVLAGDA